MIGAGAVVTRSIDEAGVYAGNPGSTDEDVVTMVRFLDLKHAHSAMLDDLVDAFRELVDESAFVGVCGRIREFEEAFAQYVGAEHCVAVANGTDAIEVVLEAIDAPSGGEIIVPANTFIATSEAVTQGGL